MLKYGRVTKRFTKRIFSALLNSKLFVWAFESSVSALIHLDSFLQQPFDLTECLLAHLQASESGIETPHMVCDFFFPQ